MPRILPAIAILITFAAIACGGDDDGDDTPPTANAGDSTLAAPTATLESSSEKPPEAPTPEPGQISVANEPFSVEAAGGAVLKGHAYTPDGPKRQALVIVAPVDQSTWAESTETYTSEGVAVFTFDPRGFGETGGAEEPEAMAADARLVTRFVMSREYPLVYLVGIGPDGGAVAAEAASSLDALTGLITYAYQGETSTPNSSRIAAAGVWSGEDVLADGTVAASVLDFIQAGN